MDCLSGAWHTRAAGELLCWHGIGQGPDTPWLPVRSFACATAALARGRSVQSRRPCPECCLLPLIRSTTYHGGALARKSLRALVRAVELAQSEPVAWYSLAQLHQKMNATDESFSAMSHAVKLTAEGAASARHSVHTLQVIVHDTARQMESLQEELKQQREHCDAEHAPFASIKANLESEITRLTDVRTPRPRPRPACPRPRPCGGLARRRGSGWRLTGGQCGAWL